VTKSTEQGSSWIVNICSVSQEFTPILWNSETHCRFRKSGLRVPILNQMIAASTHSASSFKIYFNIIFPWTLKYSNLSLRSGFSARNLCAFLSPLCVNAVRLEIHPRSCLGPSTVCVRVAMMSLLGSENLTRDSLRAKNWIVSLLDQATILNFWSLNSFRIVVLWVMVLVLVWEMGTIFRSNTLVPSSKLKITIWILLSWRPHNLQTVLSVQ
jgi:hypothetical protein